MILFTPVDAQTTSEATATDIPFRVIATFPHDISAFTQGLEFDGPDLVESTGGYGRSELRRVDWRTGEVRLRRALPPRLFGEGVTVIGDEIVQLTWRAGRALRWSLDLSPRGAHRYTGEGWGLAGDATHLFRSDGTDRIVVLDPRSFRPLRTIRVRDDQRPVHRLNELEFAEGALYANVWQTDRIARIDPANGRVTGWLDLARLRERFDPPSGWKARQDVLNGIAFQAETGHLFVTGKRWPLLFALDVDGLRKGGVHAP